MGMDQLGFNRWNFCAVGLMALISCSGCSLWDSITSRDFRVRNLFKPEDPPLVVLEKSVDGDMRAAALAKLKEPLAHGGTSQEQEKVLKVLTEAALMDRQALCRLQAIQTLKQFKDSRVPGVLRDAYYRASNFNPETGNVIKCQALEALGEARSPDGLEILIKVLREPAVIGSEQERQQKLDERIVAAKALGKYKEYQATENLLALLQADQDVALRNCCRDSLVAITGKELPAEYSSWEAYLHQGNRPREENPGFFGKILQTAGWKN
ncbi:MAG: HEAT repeat domain-containing protein [Gemmataceae bacterium]|nr:HEAT repeat domain-containing protein [Gemmataceae bacterium]